MDSSHPFFVSIVELKKTLREAATVDAWGDTPNPIPVELRPEVRRYLQAVLSDAIKNLKVPVFPLEIEAKINSYRNTFNSVIEMAALVQEESTNPLDVFELNSFWHWVEVTRKQQSLFLYKLEAAQLRPENSDLQFQMLVGSKKEVLHALSQVSLNARPDTLSLKNESTRAEYRKLVANLKAGIQFIESIK